jgi:hypothetical protein
MPFDLGSLVPAHAVDRRHVTVRPDYAERARAEHQTQQRREIVWAVLSLIALILCWDLSARVDRTVVDGDVHATGIEANALVIWRKPGAPRRLRKMSEEAHGDEGSIVQGSGSSKMH